MTTLKDLVIKKTQVLGVDVYALSIKDFVSLVQQHEDAMKALFEGKSFESVIASFPDFVASIIALGTRSDKTTAEQLAFGIQIELLAGIWQVSQVDVDTLGKVIAGIMSGVMKLSSNLETGKTVSLKPSTRS